jgi:hypothetical protein
MAYKQKGWTPFTHDSKNDDGTWKTDKHGQHHKSIHDEQRKKKNVKKRTSDKYKIFGDDPNKGVDPDAPGTPGKPGYEPPVKYDDLDEKGKAIWRKVRGNVHQGKMSMVRKKLKKKDYIPQSQRGDRDYIPQSQRGKKK